MKKDPRDRIPSSDLTAYERWELPLLDERGNEVWVRDDEVDLKPLTAQDLEDIRREALEDGLREGRETGYKEGFEKGHAEGRKAGHSEGHQQGEAAGREEGHAATRTEVEAGLGRLQTLMAEMLDPLERHTEALETALLNLTLSLTRAVVHRELKLDSSQIRSVLKQALAALPSQDEAIRIHVNPADSEWVREVASRFEAGARIVEDEAVLAGGCRVESRSSLVDFTVEKRFQKAVQAMLDRQLQTGASGDSGELDALMGEMTDFHRDVLESQPDLAAEKPSAQAEPDAGDIGSGTAGSQNNTSQPASGIAPESDDDAGSVAEETDSEPPH